jgi:hypothetical protein
VRLELSFGRHCLGNETDSVLMMCVCAHQMQIAAKTGAPFPDWYDAGKEAVKTSPAPLGTWLGVLGTPGAASLNLSSLGKCSRVVG